MQRYDYFLPKSEQSVTSATDLRQGDVGTVNYCVTGVSDRVMRTDAEEDTVLRTAPG